MTITPNDIGSQNCASWWSGTPSSWVNLDALRRPLAKQDRAGIDDMLAAIRARRRGSRIRS